MAQGIVNAPGNVYLKAKAYTDEVAGAAQDTADAAATAASAAQTKADEAYNLADTANTTVTQAYSELDSHTINDNPTDDTTSTASPSHSGTVTMVDSVTRDDAGHVLSVNTKTVTLPSDNNTDTKVTQTNTTTSASYRLLMSATASDTSLTEAARKSTNFTVNPSTGVLTAPTFSGALSGNATSADTATSATSADKVANALTLTMNGTAATYDGSATASKTWYAPTSVAGGTGYELVASGTASTSVPAWKQPSGYVLCTTAASTAAKVSSGNATNFKLATGARVSVKFQYANTATTPTLNINSTGAKTIGIQTDYSTVTTGYANIGSWSAGEIVDFVYNGTYWVAVASSGGWLHATADELYTFSSNDFIGIDEVTTAIKERHRAATYVVAAKDSANNVGADYVCTGSADDTVIQTAIDAANSAGGGKVLLMDGTYSISSAISFSGMSNVTLEGQGAGTILNASSNINVLYLYHSTDCRISSLAITTSVESPTSGCAIYGDSAMKNVITDCIIDGNYSGIYLDYSSGRNLIDGNFVSNCSNTGIFVGRKANDGHGYNKITNNHISDCKIGIEIYYSPYSIVLGNTVKCTTGATYGIYNYYTDYTTIANNSIVSDSDEPTLIYSRGIENNINGNTLYDGYYGIYVYDNKSLVIGNVVYNAYISAISLPSTCTYTLVTGNHCYEGNISNSGSNNTVVNNITT